MKAIKRRIVSVKNTQQIMKAMNLVAASKLQKNRQRRDGAKLLFDEAGKFFLHTAPRMEAPENNIYYETRNVKRAAYVVISGERGLCGSYNANVLKLAYEQTQGKNHAHIISIGAKSKEYFVRRRMNLLQDYVGVLDNLSYSLAVDIGQMLNALYLADTDPVEEIYVVYTTFQTILTHEPKVVRLLPFVPVRGEVEDMIFEPDVEVYLRKSVPVYLSMFVYGAMLESMVCEQAARMTSMDSASRNAGEILESLTLEFNRKRQGAITQEINEIVSGANAL
jgi:F-type H+-transporting ATPase subunit gamma